MGFFKDFKRDFAQAVNELMPDKDELANEYDDEDIVNTFDDDDMEIAPEDMMENIDDINIDSPDNVQREDTMNNISENYELNDEETDNYNNIPEAEIVKEAMDDAEEEKMVGSLNEEEPVTEEILEAMTYQELAEEKGTGSDEENAEDETNVQYESEQEDELKSEDALDEDNMLENTDDALAVEPESNGLGDIDLNEAVETAINSRNDNEDSETYNYEEAGMEDIEEKILEEETTAEKEQEASSILADDTTYITKGTVIKGDIETDGGIDVIGTVEGNVKCAGKLIVGGTIEGNVEAGEIYANAAKIKGEIMTEGSVKIGVGTVVVGNVTATSAVIAGAVNGDIDVQGPVIVDSTAVIMGDIKSRSVQINNGAVIEGRCSQCYSEIDVKSFFE